MEYVVFSLIIGYLIGCIQPSYVISKIKKQNIKELGSKNAGASNVTVVFGWKYGIIVGLIDILKPVLSIFVVWGLFQSSVSTEFLLILYYLNGAAVITGHIFPFFMKFNGGKGTASTIGLFFVINWRIAILVLILFVLITILSNYIVIGAFTLNLAFLLYTWIEHNHLSTLSTVIFLVLLFVIKHKDNFIRIARGEETGLRSVLKKE